MPTITDDIGTPYTVVAGTSQVAEPERVLIDGLAMKVVYFKERLTAYPGAPRNATSLTLRLTPAVQVRQPADGDEPWPSRTIRFPHRQFTFDLSSRKRWLEYLQVPLPTIRGREVQL